MSGFDNGKESIGDRIRRFRKERNMSQITLAEMVGVTFGWISQIEQDKAKASPDLLIKIATALKVPIRELLQNEDERMELVSRIKLVEVLLETNQTTEAQKVIQDIVDHVELSEKDKITLQILQSECRYQQSHFSEVVEDLTPLAHSLEASNYHDAYILSWIRYVIGKAFYQLRDFTNALYNYRKAYDYTQRFETMNSLAAKVTYNVGVTLRMKGHHLDSIPFLEQAHNFFAETNDLKTLAYTLYEKGISYKNARDYARASECFSEAKFILQMLQNKTLYVILQHTVASEITLHQDPDLALSQLEECVQAVSEEGNILREVLIRTKIARVYLHIDSIPEACKSLQIATKLNQEHGYEKTVESAECHKTYAQYFTKTNEHQKIVDHALVAAEIFGTMGLLMDQIDSLQLVANAYEAIDDYKNALYYERECKKLALEVRKG